MLARTRKKLSIAKKDNNGMIIMEGQKEIKQQSNCKILGVILSEDMTWSNHLVNGKESVKAKMNVAFGALRKLSNKLDFK